MPHDFEMHREQYRAVREIISVAIEDGETYDLSIPDAFRNEYTKGGDFLANRITSRMSNLVNAIIDGMNYAEAASHVVWLYQQWQEIQVKGIQHYRRRGVGDDAQMQTLKDMAITAVNMGLYWAPCRWFVQSQASDLPSDTARLDRLTELFNSAVAYSQSQALVFTSNIASIYGMRVFTPAHSNNLPDPVAVEY